MLARHTDPATSHMAARMAIVFIDAQEARIVDALREYGPMGVDAIGRYVELNGHQVGKRMKKLEREGRVRLTGRDVFGASGRAQREWAAC